MKVPAGELWVMGDNRYQSDDSRYNRDKPHHGYAPISDVTGLAVVISWPIARWSTLRDYPATFADVPDSTGR